MNKSNTINFIIIIYLSLVSIIPPVKANAQNNNNMKITSIELEHTNPSLGPYEEIITITLVNSKTHLEKVNEFIKKSQINNTTSLYKFLEANINNETKILIEVYKNAPKGNLNEGESISNLTIELEGGKTIKLNDVYRNYSLTNFNPDFTSYMVKNGSRSTSNSNFFPTINNEPLELEVFEIEKTPYSDKDLIIHLALSPGGPGSSSYQLFVYRNGEFKFTGSAKGSPYSPFKNKINKTLFTKEEIDKVLNTAEEINFIELTKSLRPLPHVDDGQQTTFGIWQNGALRKVAFGYGEHAINKETKALADYILSLVEG